MNSDSQSLASAAFYIVTAIAFGYLLFRIIVPKDPAISSINVGRRWLAWTSFFTTFITFPAVVRTLGVEAVATWLFNLIIWGIIAFALGAVYGHLRPRATSRKIILVDARALNDTTSESIQGTGDSTEIEEHLFGTAAAEIGTASLDTGLWHRLLVENAGNEEATRLKYISTRASRLSRKTSDDRGTCSSNTNASQETKRSRQIPNQRLVQVPDLAPRTTQGTIADRFFAGCALMAGLVSVVAFLQQSKNVAGSSVVQHAVGAESAVAGPGPNIDAPGAIAAEADADFMKRFPEWSTPERRALLQGRINKIDMDRKANGQEHLSDTAVLEQARLQLVDEGYR